MTTQTTSVPQKVLHVVEDIGLGIIAIATVVAAGHEVWRMVTEMSVHLADLLLLFIYLEVLAMVGVYLEAHSLPVRLPIYIAIVALARYLILDIKEMDVWRIIGIASATVLLALSILIIRYGHARYPYEPPYGPTKSGG